MTVRAAATHLGPIRRQPTHFQMLTQTHFSQQLPHQQDALSAEARQLHGEVAGMVMAAQEIVIRSIFANAQRFGD